MREPEEEEDSAEPGAERPSKSARKRAAHAAQDLGEHDDHTDRGNVQTLIQLQRARQQHGR